MLLIKAQVLLIRARIQPRVLLLFTRISKDIPHFESVNILELLAVRHGLGHPAIYGLSRWILATHYSCLLAVPHALVLYRPKFIESYDTPMPSPSFLLPLAIQ